MLPKSDKYGSEHYYYDIFKDLLPEHELLTEPSIVEENCEILFIDDWILSGSNFMSIFESIFYDNYCKSNGNNNKLNCVINIITFVSGDFLEYFYEVLTSYNGILTSFLFYSYKAYLLNYYLPTTINEQLKYDFCKQFSPDTNEFAYTVHFDYKIANQFGSYPEIYTYCRTIKPDKSFMIKK